MKTSMHNHFWELERKECVAEYPSLGNLSIYWKPTSTSSWDVNEWNEIKLLLDWSSNISWTARFIYNSSSILTSVTQKRQLAGKKNKKIHFWLLGKWNIKLCQKHGTWREWPSISLKKKPVKIYKASYLKNFSCSILFPFPLLQLGQLCIYMSI